jgi:hypothetical protein
MRAKGPEQEVVSIYPRGQGFKAEGHLSFLHAHLHGLHLHDTSAHPRTLSYGQRPDYLIRTLSPLSCPFWLMKLKLPRQ